MRSGRPKLTSGGNFTNSNNASALSASSGRWVIYSMQPSSDTKGGLSEGQDIYNKNYGSLPPASITGPTYNATQNSWVYSNAPTGTITFTANNVSSTYGHSPVLTYSFSCSTGCTEIQAEIGGALALSSAGNASSNVGTYSIAAAQGSLTFNPAYGAYTINYVPGTLTINKAPLTVTPNNQSRLFGTANPALSGTISGFVNGQNASIFTSQPVYSTTAMLDSSAGFYPITAGGGLAANYSFSYLVGELNISGFAAIPSTVQNAPTHFAMSDTVTAQPAIAQQPTIATLSPVSVPANGSQVSSQPGSASGLSHSSTQQLPESRNLHILIDPRMQQLYDLPPEL